MNTLTIGSMQYRSNPEQAISCAGREGSESASHLRKGPSALAGQMGQAEVPTASPEAASTGFLILTNQSGGETGLQPSRGQRLRVQHKHPYSSRPGTSLLSAWRMLSRARLPMVAGSSPAALTTQSPSQASGSGSSHAGCIPTAASDRARAGETPTGDSSLSAWRNVKTQQQPEIASKGRPNAAGKIATCPDAYAGVMRPRAGSNPAALNLSEQCDTQSGIANRMIAGATRIHCPDLSATAGYCRPAAGTLTRRALGGAAGRDNFPPASRAGTAGTRWSVTDKVAPQTSL